MSQLDLIKKILKESYFPNNQNIMEEENMDSDGKPFQMRREIHAHKNLNYLLFRFDPDREKPFPYFNTGLELSKICDYILFAETGNTLYILLIELKYGNLSAKSQLDASEVFAQFIINSGKRVGLPFTDEIFYKKVKITETLLKRKPKTSQQELTCQAGIITHLKKDFVIWGIIDTLCP